MGELQPANILNEQVCYGRMLPFLPEKFKNLLQGTVKLMVAKEPTTLSCFFSLTCQPSLFGLIILRKKTQLGLLSFDVH